MQEGNGLQDRTTRLLLSVAEQLKAPLTQIARQAELLELQATQQTQTVPYDLGVLPAAANMSAQATAALTLVDSYLLGVDLLSQELELEPVSVSSVLVDVAHQLSGYAKQYGVSTEVTLAGKYEPVMAHPAALKAALTSLGYSLIEAQGASGAAHPGGRRIVLAGHRTAHGIAAGLYSPEKLATEAWRKAQSLYGRAQQPLASMLGTSGAGLFVADALAAAMASELRVTRRAREYGLALTLVPSQQLQFI